MRRLGEPGSFIECDIRLTKTCRTQGLHGEFEAQVALIIREQLRDYSRVSISSCIDTIRNIADAYSCRYQLIREGLKSRVSKLPPVSAAFRDRLETKVWGPSVKFILADDIPQLEREDFKRMRPLTRPTMHVTLPPPPSTRPNRPPKPVNTFLMFCRYDRRVSYMMKGTHVLTILLVLRCRQNRKKIMADYPSSSAKDASKILGDMWQKLSEKERARCAQHH